MLLYLENIHEFVEDHNVIVRESFASRASVIVRESYLLQVTYKWLSRELNVPVNAAKQ